MSQGVAIQVNDQKVLWTTHSGESLWKQRVKPYIYNLFASDTSDIFVATDGAGGRLFRFDSKTGQETFNFRPTLGGLGDCYFF
jgi:outer membrane protein assembly factor BamB